MHVAHVANQEWSPLADMRFRIARLAGGAHPQFLRKVIGFVSREAPVTAG